MIYAKEKNYTLYQGKMQDVLDTLEENSIDSIVCDPPYELNFMGKGWDNQGIAFQPDTWKHCYKVLKDGGYLLAFGGSRTFHRIACAIEDAGFEIRDTIMWLYGSGFPKSMDISKQIDKRGGNNTSFLCNLIKEKREEKNLSQKQLDELMGTNGMVNWWEKGERGITPIQFNKLCEILEFPFKNIKEAEREVIGNITRTKGVAIPACGEKIDRSSYPYKITTPTTDLAKQWQGWGTCLKPAYEPIIVARKPFKGSLVDNVIENGVGGLNIDECRVAFNGDKWQTQKSGKTSRAYQSEETTTAEGICFANDNGRFPANVILTYDETDFDEVCGGFPDTKGGNRHNTAIRKNDKTSYGYELNTRNEFNDSGSASRYFYCAKASKKDRDEGLDLFLEQVDCDRNEDCYSADVPFNRSANARKNIHPTVKPIELMQYLVRLVTPKNATILDCFMGSGSTGKAVMFENRERNANYHFIGIEMTEEYLPICKARIDYALNKYEYDFQKQLKEEKDKGQLSIFDFMEN